MIQNQTIILIHGAGSISDAWDNFKKSFESMGNTVINPTLRYHQRGYKSDPKLGNTSILDYVKDIEKIIKKLQQKPIIIGYSMGGLIALILCSKGYGKLGIFLKYCLNKNIKKTFPKKGIVKPFNEFIHDGPKGRGNISPLIINK